MATTHNTMNTAIFEGPKYYCTPETLKQTLSEYGVAVIPNVLDEEECNSMVSKLWDFFEHISQGWKTPINRNNIATYRGIHDLFPSHGMLFQFFGIGHAQASWDMRQNPKIIDIFAKFWGCAQEELLVSFDGLSFGLPPEFTNRGYAHNNWLHTDQSYTRPEFECVQSWVTGFDVSEGDATLGFFEGSHKFHKDFSENMKVQNRKENWFMVKEPAYVQYYMERCGQEKRIVCSKGSMVFWDSRTVHCGLGPIRGRPAVNMRAVVYLCYLPRSTCPPKELKKKQEAFNALRTTNHWANQGKKFAKTPRTYGNPIPEITAAPPPTVSELGLKLAGF